MEGENRALTNAELQMKDISAQTSYSEELASQKALRDRAFCLWYFVLLGLSFMASGSTTERGCERVFDILSVTNYDQQQ